ncbi:protein S40-7-like [Lotus japonicus]|uniref:protein S40-7-like n=1 Tax=Lotus japonicus TaxID=34305 RepID=UPI0025878578|nr:protein S40-7-like [Lotus japonicus]
MDLYDPNRFFGVPPQNRTSDDDDLIEDDVVFSLNDLTEPSSPSHRRKGFASGILAALPGNDDASPHFFQKAPVSVSVPVPSSSRPIPRPRTDRTPTSPARFHQSAPVNVPVMSPGMMKAARRRLESDEDEGDAAAEEEDGEMMLPPHELVARNSAVLACSCLEGVGRTLKGRDLRRVRNAVLRQTGFL